ncbi:NADH dehydrogenase [compost metagenome]
MDKWFQEHEVETLSHISIQSFEQGVLHHESGDIYSDVTVWTAGIQPVKIVQDLTVAKDKQGRVVPGAHYQIPDHPEVFVCGDCASLPFAPSDQAAEGQGHQIAHTISSMWHGGEPKLSKKPDLG